MDRQKLISEIKSDIIATLNLQGMLPEDISDDTPLFDDEGLGLDSVDALELVVMLEKNYGVEVDDKAEARTVFASAGAMADFVISKKA